MSVHTTNRKRPGRPRGSIDRVLQGRDFGLDHFAAVKAFLYGLDPLNATKRYLLQDDAPSSTEAAMRQLGDLMLLIAERGRSRRHGPEDAANNSHIRAADSIEKAGKACLQMISEITAERKRVKDAQRSAMEEEAAKRNLKYVPKAKLPSPPPHFATLRAFDDWYEDKYRPDELLDRLELAAKFQEHLSDWYESQGYYSPPDYSQSHHQFSEQVRVSATQMEDAPRTKTIDPALRSLAAKHIDTLQWTVQRLPAAADHVKAWIGGSTLKALVDSDIFTLYSLGELVKRHGASWWKQIPKLGPVRAARLRAWLVEVKVQGIGLTEEHFESIQYRRLIEVKAFLESNSAPPALTSLQLEPLAPYLENEELNGSTGIFRRREANMLKAEDDISAIVSALSKYKDKRETLKVYAREICRFCLWAYRVKKLPLSSIGIEDAREYREFLGNIPSEWVTTATDAPPRGSSEWRPFRGALDGASQRKALTSINVILSQLMEGGYLSGNPMAGVLKKSGLAKPQMDVMRSFSIEQWDLICEVMKSEPPSPASRRTMALMYLLYSTGIRRDELFKARLSDFTKMRVDGEVAQLLTVEGKGSKKREVMVPNEVMAMIESHLLDRPALFNDEPATTDGRAKIPLISVIKNTVKAFQLTEPANTNATTEGEIVLEARKFANESGALSPDGMASVLNRLLQKCKVAATERGMDTASFESASLHWMRHTFGHTMADAEVDLRVIQKAMGHVNINTTGHYSKAELKQMVRGLRVGQSIAAQATALTHTQTETPEIEE